MPSLRETVLKKDHFPMWVGTEGDLQRLFALIERPFERLIDAHVEERTQYVRGRAESAEEEVTHTERMLALVRWSQDNANQQRMIAQARSELDKANERVATVADEARLGGRLKLSVSTDDKETRHTTGTAQELAEYLQGRKFREIEIEAPSGAIEGYEILLTANVLEGVDLRVRSADADWATATFADLEGALRAKVPGWHWLRSALFLYALYLVAMVAIGVTVVQIVFPWLAPDGTMDWVPGIALAVGCTFLGFFVALLGNAYTRRRIPAFEVVELGEKSKGRFLFGVIGGAGFAVALNIFANVLSPHFTG